MLRAGSAGLARLSLQIGSFEVGCRPEPRRRPRGRIHLADAQPGARSHAIALVSQPNLEHAPGRRIGCIGRAVVPGRRRANWRRGCASCAGHITGAAKDALLALSCSPADCGVHARGALATGCPRGSTPKTVPSRELLARIAATVAEGLLGLLRSQLPSCSRRAAVIASASVSSSGRSGERVSWEPAASTTSRGSSDSVAIELLVVLQAGVARSNPAPPTHD